MNPSLAPASAERINLFGLQVTNETLHSAAISIADKAKADRRERVFFVNAHCVNVAVRDTSYRQALRSADVLYGDGSGVRMAAKAAGKPLVDNVNGTDMFPILCQEAADKGVPIALLGAQPEIVAKCAENMQKRTPGLEIAYARDGFFTEEQIPGIVEEINNSGAKIVFVAMGVPKQELFVEKIFPNLDAPQVLAVGGLFDFYSGLRVRAPFLIRKLGLEWMVRLAQEPRRLFRRYILGNPEFLARLLKLRLKGRKVVQQELT